MEVRARVTHSSSRTRSVERLKPIPFVPSFSLISFPSGQRRTLLLAQPLLSTELTANGIMSAIIGSPGSSMVQVVKQGFWGRLDSALAVENHRQSDTGESLLTSCLQHAFFMYSQQSTLLPPFPFVNQDCNPSKAQDMDVLPEPTVFNAPSISTKAAQN